MRALRAFWSWLGASLMAALFAAIAYGIAITVLGTLAALVGAGGFDQATFIGVYSVFVAAPVHFIGIALLAPIAMIVLRRCGQPSERAAVLAGGALATSAAVALFSIFFTTAGPGVLLLAIPTLVSGAVGGWTYRALIAPEG